MKSKKLPENIIKDCRKLENYFKACHMDAKFNLSQTVLLPSPAMFNELDNLFKAKKMTELAKKISSLISTVRVTNIKQFIEPIIDEKYSYEVQSTSKDKVNFKNGTSGTKISDESSISLWKLNGDHLPQITRQTKRGAFEQPEEIEKPNEYVELIFETLRKPNGVKQVICDLYWSIKNEDERAAADCIICGNPWAEFFVLYDSPIFKIDEENFVSKSVENVEEAYKELCMKRGDFVVNCFDESVLNKIKTAVSDESFIDQLSANFYKSIEENGIYELDGKEYKICHPALSKYWFKIELFYAFIKPIGEKLDEAIKTKNTQEFEKLLREVILFNDNTNSLTVESTIKKYEDENSPYDFYNRFKDQFSKCGLCLFKIVSEPNTEVTGGREKKTKMKSRKLSKIKDKYNKLSSDEKKKIMSYLTKLN